MFTMKKYNCLSLKSITQHTNLELINSKVSKKDKLHFSNNTERAHKRTTNYLIKD